MGLDAASEPVPVEPGMENLLVSVLNDCLRLDAKACNELLSHRVECNEALADHGTIRVQVLGGKKGKQLGLLALINGAVEQASGKRVAMVMDDNCIVGFTLYQPEA